jgi:uncharacterized membrane protein
LVLIHYEIFAVVSFIFAIFALIQIIIIIVIITTNIHVHSAAETDGHGMQLAP